MARLPAAGVPMRRGSRMNLGQIVLASLSGGLMLAIAHHRWGVRGWLLMLGLLFLLTLAAPVPSEWGTP